MYKNSILKAKVLQLIPRNWKTFLLTLVSPIIVSPGIVFLSIEEHSWVNDSWMCFHLIWFVGTKSEVATNIWSTEWFTSVWFLWCEKCLTENIEMGSDKRCLTLGQRKLCIVLYVIWQLRQCLGLTVCKQILCMHMLFFPFYLLMSIIRLFLWHETKLKRKKGKCLSNSVILKQVLTI